MLSHCKKSRSNNTKWTLPEEILKGPYHTKQFTGGLVPGNLREGRAHLNIQTTFFQNLRQTFNTCFPFAYYCVLNHSHMYIILFVSILRTAVWKPLMLQLSLFIYQWTICCVNDEQNESVEHNTRSAKWYSKGLSIAQLVVVGCIHVVCNKSYNSFSLRERLSWVETSVQATNYFFAKLLLTMPWNMYPLWIVAPFPVSALCMMLASIKAS